MTGYKLQHPALAGDRGAGAIRTVDQCPAAVMPPQRTFPGVTHEFCGMGNVVRGVYDAGIYAIGRPQKAFDRR